MIATDMEEDTKSVDKEKIFRLILEITKISKMPVYNNKSDHASLVWIILKKNDVTPSELYFLFVELHKTNVKQSALEKIFSTPETLANWFFNLCKPSAAGGGLELRKWLLTKKIQPSVFQQYLSVDIKDVGDFFFGFLLGVSKSLTYDNIKGIFDLLILSAEAPALLTKIEIERLIVLSREYESEGAKSFERVLEGTNRLMLDLTISLSKNDPFSDYKRMNLIGRYLVELRIILAGFLVNPYIKVSNAELEKFNAVYLKICALIDKETEGYRKASGIWDYVVVKKYYGALDQKVTPLLLQFRFFEAGIVFGEIVASIAQIIAGLVSLARSAGKRLAQLSATSKARAVVLLTLLSTFEGPTKKLPIIFADSPAIALSLSGEKEVTSFAKAIEESAPYFETQNIKMIDVDVARQLSVASPATSRVPGLFESSVIGIEPHYLISIFGVLALMRRRKSVARRGSGDDEFDAVVIVRWQELFQEGALKRMLGSAETNRYLLSAQGFCDELAKAVNLKVPTNATPEQILKLFADDAARNFEKEIAALIKDKKNKKIFSRNNIYSLFNSYLNKRLRPVAEQFKAKGGVILVDQRIATLTETILKKEATLVYRGKEAKVDKILGEFTVMDFHETYFPELKLKQQYDVALKNLKKTQSELYKMFQKRDELVRKLNVAIKSKKSTAAIDTMLEEIDDMSYSLGYRLDELAAIGKVDKTTREGLLLYQYGKTNPYGFCGSLRPDIQIISLFESNSNFDFVHVAEGATSTKGHQIGGDMYTNVHLVLFGEAPTETIEILYTFSKKFLGLLAK
jgi:hypothetical protein